ncbi:serine--tRNA ligase, putative [Plasmodium gallinaceum]|uniref:serine--tRNA ligase n=1 Tax=Plasmodium gallinaceum TaxID=5849 RepID=A0A1J1GZV0_PLAGA|nr:serine--tRNA ligase, putative [Plasmodium gallinaceum]CRG97729.1 serine--tRNA ligase, putative [Plasmodium gallinaceum]
MHVKTLILLNILFIHYLFGKCRKNTKKLFINLYNNKWGSLNLIKKHSVNFKNKHNDKIDTLDNEYGMSLKILKINENKVIENLRKRGMEKYLNTVEILKKLIEEKNKLETIRNNLRNKRKILSDEVKNLMLSKNYSNKDIEKIENSNITKSEKDGLCSENDSCKKSDNNESNHFVIEYKNSKQKKESDKMEYFKINCEKEIEHIKNEINEINSNIYDNETKMSDLKCKIEKYFNKMPNILLNNVPQGKTVNDCKIVKTYKVKNMEINENAIIKAHEDIIKKYDNNYIFSNIPNKIGFGYNILVNNIAKLEKALIDFMINIHVNKFKYIYVKTPVIVAKSALTNTGQLPKFENDLFKINKNYKILNEEAYLIPTSEVSLLNLFKNSLINHDHLPVKLVSHSSCFRIEKNFTYGKTSKGLLREHIFEKVELIAITDKKSSLYYYKELIKHCEYILKKLKIPYRLVLLNSFETPFSASICYDIEAWLPSQKRFIEVSSCSNCLDFQSRKLNLKFKENGKKFFCHTINGSGLAVGRVLAIILEQYQIQNKEKNDKIQLNIPKPLRKYMNASTIIL